MDGQRGAGRRRFRIALIVSILVHVGVAGVLALLMNVPVAKPAMKQGDSLLVELSNVEEPRPGTPAGRILEEARPAPPPPPAKREPPPAPAVKPAPAARPAAPTPPRVAAAPPAPAPPRAVNAPPASAPVPAPAAPPSDAASTAAPPPAPAPDAIARPEPTPNSGLLPAPTISGEAPRLASVPRDSGAAPGGRPTPDLRALRGSGGVGTGRGGIEGEAISLNSDDPKLADYLQRVKRAIERHWAWPCMKKPGAAECEYTSANLHVEFGILKNGTLQFIELRQTSGLVPYDESAMTAIKLASPFPTVPPALMAKAKSGSTGVPIVAHFIYQYEVSIRSLLR
jgi:outer membrane biosynthesis protein TonB